MRVLLVEDDELDREAIRRALRAELAAGELVLDEALSLEEARRVLSEQVYHCVLSDLSLPDGEGLELARVAGGSAFVVLTGAAVGDARSALHHGAQDYLMKDHLEPYWLARALRYAVERKQHQLYQRELEHQDRLASLGHLAASVAHEINNPTAFVLANLEAMDQPA